MASTPIETAPAPAIDSDHAADQLDAEANAIRATMNAEAAMPHAVMPEIEQAPAPAPRQGSRHMPISAPVSRDVPSASGKRFDDGRKITLTAEERIIARNSFSA